MSNEARQWARSIVQETAALEAAPEMRALLRAFVDAYKAHPERLGANSQAQAHFFAAQSLLARIDGAT